MKSRDEMIKRFEELARYSMLERERSRSGRQYHQDLILALDLAIKYLREDGGMNKAKRLPIALEKAGHKIALAISKGEEGAYHQGQIDALDWVTEIFWGDPDEWEDEEIEEDENSFEESEMFSKGEA